ncbi:hypothetical protein ACFLQU_06060, partial [Verrucomicrobiota bacterium]
MSIRETHRALPAAAAVLLLITVAAFVFPVLGSGRRKAERKECLTNLRRIDSGRVGTIVPVCPSEGAYSIPATRGGPYPTCSHHGDLLQEEDGARKLTVVVE